MHVRYWAAAAAILSAVTALVAGHFLRSGEWAFATRIVLSLAPVLPMSVYCVLAVRIIRTFDELQARIHLEGALFGLLGTALLTMASGLLVRGGVIPPFTLASAWPWLWIAAFLLWGIGTVTAAARYR